MSIDTSSIDIKEIIGLLPHRYPFLLVDRILEIEKAKSIIINKRSMNPGYAGIENELFFNQKTSMLFGDAKDVLTKLVQELKNM